MLVRVLVPMMLAALTAEPVELPDNFDVRVRETLRLDRVPPPERPLAAISAEEMGKQYGLALIPYLRPHMEHVQGHESLQFPVFVAMSGIQRACETEAEHQQLVDEMVRWLCDTQQPPSGNIAKLLRRMSSMHFSEDAKKKLLEELAKAVTDTAYYGYKLKHLILIIGVADIPEALPLLAQKAYKPTDDPKEILAKIHIATWPYAWDAPRARARMGVKEDIELCIKVVDATEDKRDLTSHLFGHLTYIRRPESVEYAKTYLFSDEIVDYDAKDIVEATYARVATGALAGMLEGFPIEPGHFPITDEDIAKCREWMRGRAEYTLRR